MGRTRSLPRASQDQYATVQPQTRHVSRAAVKKRWKKLPRTTQETVRETLKSVQQQSIGRRGYQKRNLLRPDTSVDSVVAHLTEKLPRMPFPPGMREDCFDDEFTVAQIRKLEEELTANANTIKMLSTHIRREQALLQDDHDEVARLQHSLKSSNVFRRQQARGLHRLARDSSLRDVRHSMGLSDGAVDASSVQFSTSVSELGTRHMVESPEAATVMRQLGDHLETMLTNMAGMASVSREMARAQLYLGRIGDRMLSFAA